MTSGEGSERYDVIVLGCGSMGAAACMHLARKGARVLGIERFRRGHAFGSGHGHSRVIRQAYFEHADYVPLLRRTYELFRALERDSGEALFMECGAIFAGREDSDVVRGSVLAAQTHGVPHELLGLRELGRRFPQFVLPKDHVALWEPGAGFVRPEATTLAQLRLAERSGARIVEETAARSCHADSAGVEVETSNGTFRASQLVVTAGAWSASLLASHAPFLRVTRQPIVWIEADAAHTAAHTAPALPVWLIDRHDGTAIYGVPPHPALDGPSGMKAALHGGGATVDPDSVDRQASSAEISAVLDAVAQVMPTAVGHASASAICLYTYSPDGQFIIDSDPSRRTIIACGFSGHGFKFAPVIGEAIAELVLDGRSCLSLDFLSGTRFSRPST